VVVKYQVPVSYPRVKKKYPSRTRLGSGRVRVPPTGKKLSLYPAPSDRVPGGPYPNWHPYSDLLANVALGHSHPRGPYCWLWRWNFTEIYHIYMVGSEIQVGETLPTMTTFNWCKLICLWMISIILLKECWACYVTPPRSLLWLDILILTPEKIR
jgi:hypothetical protein